MWWSTLTRRLEQAERLDPLVEKVTEAVNSALPQGPVKDALHGRWVGHPLHPLLVAVPIGMWSGASLLDLLAGEQSRPAARRLVGAGLLVALPTAASGYADWSELGLAKRPRRVGLVHAGVNWVALGLYGASWWARGRGGQRRGRRLALLGAGALSVGGYLGGHLAYSQGVGVSRNADHQPEPTDWTDACAESDVPEGGLHRVQVADQPVVLARSGGRLHALGETCGHWGGPLADGALEAGDGDGPCVVCPWHGSRFRLSDGGVVHGPASMPQPVYDVRTHGGRVQLRFTLP